MRVQETYCHTVLFPAIRWPAEPDPLICMERGTGPHSAGKGWRTSISEARHYPLHAWLESLLT